jgi:hypothetical protein
MKVFRAEDRILQLYDAGRGYLMTQQDEVSIIE